MIQLQNSHLYTKNPRSPRALGYLIIKSQLNGYQGHLPRSQPIQNLAALPGPRRAAQPAGRRGGEAALREGAGSCQVVCDVSIQVLLLLLLLLLLLPLPHPGEASRQMSVLTDGGIQEWVWLVLVHDENQEILREIKGL